MRTIIDFTKNGGYRLKQFTFRKMQEAYEHILKAFINFCKVPELGNFIISGMQISGNNITAGYCYIDGELCKFETAEGTLTTKIKKQVVIQSLGFKNGTNQDVFRTVSAVVDANDGAALQDFVRVSPVFDASYVHTDNNFTTALLQKLNGIEAGAEKNVQADWNEQNSQSDAFIKNKPNVLNTPLGTKKSILGNVINQDYDIVFPQALQTANYDVYYNFETTANDASQSSSITSVVHSKTSTGFKIFIRENGNWSQNLIINYLIVLQ